MTMAKKQTGLFEPSQKDLEAAPTRGGLSWVKGHGWLTDKQRRDMLGEAKRKEARKARGTKKKMAAEAAGQSALFGRVQAAQKGLFGEAKAPEAKRPKGFVILSSGERKDFSMVHLPNKDFSWSKKRGLVEKSKGLPDRPVPNFYEPTTAELKKIATSMRDGKDPKWKNKKLWIILTAAKKALLLKLAPRAATTKATAGVPSTSKAEWRAALKKDEADLKRAKENLLALERGEKVGHLTKANAKKSIAGLTQAINNKRELLGMKPLRETRLPKTKTGMVKIIKWPPSEFKKATKRLQWRGPDIYVESTGRWYRPNEWNDFVKSLGVDPDGYYLVLPYKDISAFMKEAGSKIRAPHRPAQTREMVLIRLPHRWLKFDHAMLHVHAGPRQSSMVIGKLDDEMVLDLFSTSDAQSECWKGSPGYPIRWSKREVWPALPASELNRLRKKARGGK